MGPVAVVVAWEIAEDAGFQRVVGKGEAKARPQTGHSVHVEVAGLKPGREYWYRFNAGGHASPVGRTRTAPERDAEVDRLRMAFASCQKWESGYYTAHRHLAADQPDLVLFLGDYIYEKWRAATRTWFARHPTVEPHDLASYRQRYAWYKADADLQAAHAAAPWMVTWDDHEVSNDYGGDAGPHEPRRRRAVPAPAGGGLPGLLGAHAAAPRRRVRSARRCGSTARSTGATSPSSRCVDDPAVPRSPAPARRRRRGQAHPLRLPGAAAIPTRSILGRIRSAG